MKTPKRNYEKMKIVAGEVPWGQISFARWKRKNRIAQLKRTIERLLKKNNDMAAVLKTVQRAIAVILADDTTSVEMSLKWENTIGRKEAARKARLIRRAHRRACCAINAENAKQAVLHCADAKQLTGRKEQA